MKLINNNWTDLQINWAAKGLYFGYTICCIQAFVDHGLQGAHTREPEVLQVCKNGFLPCVECAKKILAGTETLESLITNRACPTQFPDDGYNYPVKL